MSLWIRYTLHYTAPNGRRLTLYNLLREGADHVQRAQTSLGSTDFKRVAQPHAYTQEDIYMIETKGNA